MTAKVWMTVCGLLASAAVAAGTPATAAPDAPLKLAHSYPLPADIKGHFDHFGVDAEGKRLFGTAVEDRVAPAHAGKPAQVLVYSVVPAR
jgi:hypothetical protein